MNLLIHSSELEGPPQGRRLIGAEHGEMPVSLFLVDAAPGTGPALHRHPYAELFVVHAGRAVFQLDGAQLAGAAGDILIAPAGTAHRFSATGTEPLRLTAIHTAPAMDTEWL